MIRRLTITRSDGTVTSGDFRIGSDNNGKLVRTNDAAAALVAYTCVTQKGWRDAEGKSCEVREADRFAN